MTADVIADAITATVARLNLFERIGHPMIAFGRILASQMLALGMLSFSTGDLL